MKLSVFVIAVLLSSSALAKFSGDATVYTDAVASSSGFSGYACGFLYAPTKARSLFAAVNAPQYEGASNCGKCARVICVDSRCKSKKPVTVMLVDKCPECKFGDLDFSMPAWEEITGYPPDRLKIEWDFVSCDSLVDNSPPNLSIDPGANLWWVSVQISNHRYGIKSVRIKSSGADWKLTHRAENNFFIANFNQLKTPFTVEVTEENSNKYSASFSKFQCGMTFPFPAQLAIPGPNNPTNSTNSTGAPLSNFSSNSNKTSNGSTSTNSSKNSTSTTKNNSSNNTFSNISQNTSQGVLANSTSSPPTNTSSPSGNLSNSGSTTYQYRGSALTDSAADFLNLPSGASNQACGFYWLPTKARSFFGGVSSSHYKTASQCGVCVRVRCLDPRCKTRKEIKYMVTNECAGCAVDSILLSKSAWAELTDNANPGMFATEWNFEDCDDFLEGVPKLNIDKGSNPWWVSLQISNTKYPVASVRVKGETGIFEDLQRQRHNFWTKSFNPPLRSPFTVEVVDSNGNTLSKVFNDMQAGATFSF